MCMCLQMLCSEQFKIWMPFYISQCSLIDFQAIFLFAEIFDSHFTLFSSVIMKVLLYSFHFHMTGFTWMRNSCCRSEGINSLSSLVDFSVLGLSCAITLAELRLGVRHGVSLDLGILFLPVGPFISASYTSLFSSQVSKGWSLQLGLTPDPSNYDRSRLSPSGPLHWWTPSYQFPSHQS